MTNRLGRPVLAAVVTSALGLAAIVIPGLGDDPHGLLSAADERTYTGGRF